MLRGQQEEKTATKNEKICVFPAPHTHRRERKHQGALLLLERTNNTTPQN
jgi:hypothetical protein